MPLLCAPVTKVDASSSGCRTFSCPVLGSRIWDPFQSKVLQVTVKRNQFWFVELGNAAHDLQHGTNASQAFTIRASHVVWSGPLTLRRTVVLPTLAGPHRSNIGQIRVSLGHLVTFSQRFPFPSRLRLAGEQVCNPPGMTIYERQCANDASLLASKAQQPLGDLTCAVDVVISQQIGRERASSLWAISLFGR